MDQEQPSNRELLWRQYNLHVDLYKYYFDIALKANIFFYGITGAILTYYFANSSQDLIKYSLLLPMVMSFGLSILFIYSSFLMTVIRDDIFDLRKKLGLQTAPDVHVLIMALRVFAVTFFCVAIAMVVHR